MSDKTKVINIPESDNTLIDPGLAIAKGEIVGTSFIHKFGEAQDFDIADGFVPIWDGANDGGTDIMSYTFSTTADIDRVISTAAADTVDVEVQGLDSSYNVLKQTVTLNGQTAVALPTSLIRVFRIKNVDSADLAGTVSCYVDSATVGGVVSTKSKVRAIVTAGNNQTLMAIYTIPANKTGYMRSWYASISRKRNVLSTIKLFARPFGQVFQLKHISSMDNSGTSYIQHRYKDPEKFSEKTDIMIKASTSADGIGVAAGFDIVLIDN